MKIGIDARFYHPRHTGLSRYLRELIYHLLKIDRTNQYILFMNNEARGAFRKDFPRLPKQVKIINFDYPHYSLGEQVKFIKVLKNQKLDLVHFPHFNHPIFYRDPYVVTIFDLTLSFYAGRRRWLPAKKWAYNWVLLSAIQHSKKIIASSENTRQELISRLKTPKDKVAKIYLGAPKAQKKVFSRIKINKILAKYKINKPYLIYVGQWRTHKNLIRMIEGFDRAIKTGLQANLAIVGTKDPLFPELGEIVKEKRLTRKVIFTGFVSDEELDTLYSEATAYVFPSLSEGFGLPPLEAMARGVPAICSDASCLPEVLEDAAEYFDPYDTNDIARAIKSIIKNKKRQSSLRRKGFVQIKKYSWEKMAKETLMVYNEAVKSG